MKLLVYILLSFAVIFAGYTVTVPAQETTWELPPSSTQLEMDPTIVPIGKGSVFVPAMTDPDNEPNYGVLNDDGNFIDAPMGHRIPLEPGIYTVVYGSGTLDQMMKKKVKVVEASTTLIKPDWAGLVIEVINESRSKVREYYELLDLRNGVSYGIGQGVEQGLDEQLRTWILPPGQYKIVKPGGNITDLQNFGTIRLMPGELAHTVLVIDSDTMNFLGFGYRTDVRQMTKTDRKWTTLSELAGNALLNYTPTTSSSTESEGSFTATVQWLNDIRYENGRHIIPIWSNIEEGLSMQEDRLLRKYTDKAEIKLTYIYRFTNLLSPYIRAAAESRFFATSLHFEEPTDYQKTSSPGDTTSIFGADNIKLAGAFSPIYLKQGFGINSILVKSMPLNVNLRGGYGARQTMSRNAYTFNNETNVLSYIPKAKITGVEFLLLGDLRLGKYILFDTEFDILMPESNRKSWVYDGENRLRLSLTSSVSLLFTMEFWKYENMDEIQTRYQTLLRFSKYL
ncbi:hypothetical protein ACFL47_07275 [Candidatus Latescibacterota bacterium]